MRFVFHLIYLFACLSISAQGDTENFKLYTSREGLSTNSILCIMQDSRKFLWMGTREGLNRFDGQQFKKFFYQKNNTNSLAGNYIFNILEYKYGQLLISTNNGLSVLNTLTGQFENERIGFAPLKAGSGTTVLTAVKTGDGRILVNHEGEMDMLDNNLKYLYRLTDLDWARSLKGCIIYDKRFIDNQHRLWLGSDTSGFQVIDFLAKRVWNYKNNPEKLAYLGKAGQSIRSFFLDEINKVLWYAPWGVGLIKQDLVTHKEQRQLFDHYEFSEMSTVNAIIAENNRYLLCAVGQRIYEVDRNSLSYTKIIDYKNITKLIQTTDRQFWAATGQGLIQFKVRPPAYRELLLPAHRQTLDLIDCTGMAIAKNGKIYVAYRKNAFFEIGKDRTTITSFKLPDRFKLPGQRNIYLTRVCEDKTGRIWVGTDQGLFLFDAGTKKFSQPVYLPKMLRRMIINVVYCDADSNVWIGTRAPFTLFRMDAGQNRPARIRNEVIDRFGSLYADSRVSGITEDKQGNLWMSSQLGGGIIDFNKTSGRWKLYPRDRRYISQLIDQGIVTIHPDEQHNLWMADFKGYGLIRYNYLTDSIYRFGRDNGLASDYQQAVIADESNNLWISSDYAVTKFNVQDQTIVSYNLQSKPPEGYGYMANLFDPVTNSLVYGLHDRLLFIELGRLKKDTVLVIPLIDRVTVNNKEIFIGESEQKIRLGHDQNNIAIEFTGVDLLEDHHTRFAYQLSGLDTSWWFSDASRSAYYANLPPGDYAFRIKTANESDEWSKIYETFPFTIMPVYWQTTWFWLSVLLLISFLIFRLVRRRIKTIRKEEGLKHKLAETEMMALRSQMNPHFIFNCLNAIDNLIQTGQADKATTYLSRFAKLIRSVLESTKNNVVPFYKDFETLQLFLDLEQFRCNNKFTYEISADEELLNGDYKVPPLIIQPFVENAIHHGLLNKEAGDRRVIVKAFLENNFIKYLVQDNGVGRIKAYELKALNRPEHQSYGIDITSERIHLHNQDEDPDDVVINDLMAEGRPGGTAVIIKLRIQ